MMAKPVSDDYQTFLESKRQVVQASGFTVAPEAINPMLFPFQRDAQAGEVGYNTFVRTRRNGSAGNTAASNHHSHGRTAMATFESTDSASGKQGKGHRKIDRVGQRYGRLLVRRDVGRSSNGDILWECECDCGNLTTVRASNLSRGNTTSCGCFHRERQRTLPTKHGMKSTRAYIIWSNMKQRCINPNRADWPNYGGRGVKVCERWQTFENFVADMGEPLPDQTLDRISVDGNYEPSNCRWATLDEQTRNRRNNRYVTFEGKTQTLVAWSDELGISYWTLHARLRRGWSIERTFTADAEGQE